jgi:catechol 2,3-dioxygenase-like lactoylglutathione lyase family enzyme
MPDVRWMFHATAMGPDYDGIFGPLARLFGCRVLHRQQLPEPVGRDGGMTWIGDNSIEIGAPYGEGSSVAAFVERLGGGMHSVAVQVPDLAATLARLEPLGVEVSSRISPEIVFTRSSGTGGLVLEWASHVQDDDPRWGAPVPPFVVEPLVDVDRMAFVGAVVRDPERDGEQLAEVLDTELVTYDHHDAVDVPHRALDLGDCLLALYPVPPDAATSRAVWGGVYERPRCLALGLSVADQDVSERALVDAGLPVHHRSSALHHAVLVDGLPFPVVLTDRLLGGDPRSTDSTQEER